MDNEQKTASEVQKPELTGSESVSEQTVPVEPEKPADECATLPEKDVPAVKIFDELVHDAEYSIKWIKFGLRDVPIIIQNLNGPCPIIAVANVLFLRGDLRLPLKEKLLDATTLISILTNYLLEHRPAKLADDELKNYETQLGAVLALFPRLHQGLDINVKFLEPTSFEYTDALELFDLFSIKLVHGWLPDPENETELVSFLGTTSYNQLLDRLVTDEETSSSIALHSQVQDFINSTQLTYHGLIMLNTSMKEGQLAVLFRNNHFSVITRHEERIYSLLTDFGFLHQADIVWEVLHNIDGDTEYVDSGFKLYRPPALSTLMSQQQPITSGVCNTEADEQLAIQLQNQLMNEHQSQNSSGQETHDLQSHQQARITGYNSSNTGQERRPSSTDKCNIS